MRCFIRLLLIPGIVGWLLGGCSEKIEPKPATYSQLLTGTEKKAWRLVSLQVIDDGNASSVTPVTQLGLSACRIDDQYVFYAGEERKFDYANGPSKCAPSESDVLFSNTWTLTSANATLEFVIPIFDGQVLPYTIKNLTENVLTVELYYDKVQQSPDNINVSYRFTFNSVTTK